MSLVSLPSHSSVDSRCLIQVDGSFTKRRNVAEDLSLTSQRKKLSVVTLADSKILHNQDTTTEFCECHCKY